MAHQCTQSGTCHGLRMTASSSLASALVVLALAAGAAPASGGRDDFAGQWEHNRIVADNSTPGCLRVFLDERRFMLIARPDLDGRGVDGGLFDTRFLLHWRGDTPACAETPIGSIQWEVGGAVESAELPIRAFFGKCAAGSCQGRSLASHRLVLRRVGDMIEVDEGQAGRRIYRFTDVPNAAAPSGAPAFIAWTREAYRQEPSVLDRIVDAAERQRMSATLAALGGVDGRIVRMARVVDWEDGKPAQLEVSELRGKAGGHGSELAVFRESAAGIQILSYYLDAVRSPGYGSR